MWSNNKTPVYALVMGFILLISVLSLVVGSMTSSISIPAIGTLSYSRISWLHTSGTELYDSNNNLTRLYLAVIHDGQGFHVSQSDIQHIADMGFKGLRFFIYWGQCQPTASTISAAYFLSGTGEPGGNAIDNIVNWAFSAKLYVLLCPVWTSYWAPPAWAQTSTGMTSAGADMNQRVDFLNNTTIQAGVNKLYSYLAQRYASYSNVCFESFNELEAEHQYPNDSPTEIQKWADFNNMWISTIEANEGSTSHIKVLELLYDWCPENYVLCTPFLSGSHSNIILGVHSYPLAKSPYSEIHRIGTEWANFAHEQNYPLTCTEGSNQQGGNLTQWASEIVSLGFVGWGYFDFTSPTDDQFYNVNYASSAPAILAVLQPYMLAR